MFNASQNIHPSKAWESVTVYMSPKGEGNCVGIQLHDAFATYSISIHCSEGSPAALLRKLHVSISDLYMKLLEEEENK